MSDYYPPGKGQRLLEWILAAGGALSGTAVALLFGIHEARLVQPPGGGTDFSRLFPLPGIYLVEIIVLSCIGLYLVSHANQNISAGKKNARRLWLVPGVLLAFVILGGFSIGPYLIPALLLFILAGALAIRRTHGGWMIALGLMIIAALLQGVSVWLVITTFPNI